MLDMPLPCKLLRNFNSKAFVTHLTSGASQFNEDTLSLIPSPIGEVVNLTWSNLSYKDVQTIEAVLQSSKATIRLLWETYYYLLEDGYSVSVETNKPTITASFRRVA